MRCILYQFTQITFQPNLIEFYMKCNFIFLIFVATVLGLCVDYASASPATRINPDKDLVYLGAFRVPNDKTNQTNFDYGGGGLSFREDGDPGNTDAFPGSLFGIGKANRALVNGVRVNGTAGNISEYAIPVPASPGTPLSKLPYASSIQTLHEVTGGLVNGETAGAPAQGIIHGLRMGDVQYLKQSGNMPGDRLLWVMYEYYTPELALRCFGWSNVNIANPEPTGTARLAKVNAAESSKYLFEIPAEWANAYTQGRRIMAGRVRGQAGGSEGPTFYAINPEKYTTLGSPLSSQEKLDDGTGLEMDNTVLMNYTEAHPFLSWSRGGDEWNDGAWVSVGAKSAVMLVGIKAIRDKHINGWLRYGRLTADDCGQSGYSYTAVPYYGAIMFYDPDDLAQVAKGARQPYEVTNYATYSVEKFLYGSYQCRRSSLGGVAYDSKNNLLYIEELQPSKSSGVPVIHVFRVQDGGEQSLDTTPPTAPTNVVVTAPDATSRKISWNPSADDSGTVYYIVYRHGEPIPPADSHDVLQPNPQSLVILSGATTEYTDTKFSKVIIGEPTYTVEARDAMNNSSMAMPAPAIMKIN
ncbi:MAG: fibronectin type III domain-containing protein [Thermodesulfobacteriota bacterium]